MLGTEAVWFIDCCLSVGFQWYVTQPNPVDREWHVREPDEAVHTHSVLQQAQGLFSALRKSTSCLEAFSSKRKCFKISLEINRTFQCIQPRAFAGLQSLRILSLHGNDISLLPETAFASLSNITHMWGFSGTCSFIIDFDRLLESCRQIAAPGRSITSWNTAPCSGALWASSNPALFSKWLYSATVLIPAPLEVTRCTVTVGWSGFPAGSSRSSWKQASHAVWLPPRWPTSCFWRRGRTNSSTSSTPQKRFCLRHRTKG